MEKYREYEARRPARWAWLALAGRLRGLGLSHTRADASLAPQLIHARWAMLGAFGALLPEALSAFGGDSIPGAVWWQVRSQAPGSPHAPYARIALARHAGTASPAPQGAVSRPVSARSLRCAPAS